MKAIAATEIAGAKKALLPDFVEPSLAYLVPEPPVGEEWLHEIKFDGYRLQARIEAGSVRLLTRSGQDWTPRFANVAQSLKKLKVNSALIDGEVVVQDDKGASSFAMLVDALKAGRSDRMVFFAFDLLYLDGRDLRAATLRNRKRLLEALLATSPKTSRICYSDHLIGDGAAMLRQVCEMGLEGIVAKRADKPYQSGRRGSWVKIKCIQTDEFVIGGYLNSTAEKESVGALVCGYFEGTKFVYAGRVGTGYSRRTAHELWGRLQPLRQKSCPFAGTLTTMQKRGVVWLNPEIVAQVNYTGWTNDNLLRHAAFVGLREDKPAREVRMPPRT